jgi:hypothetical protein
MRRGFFRSAAEADIREKAELADRQRDRRLVRRAALWMILIILAHAASAHAAVITREGA